MMLLIVSVLAAAGAEASNVSSSLLRDLKSHIYWPSDSLLFYAHSVVLFGDRDLHLNVA